MFRLCELLIKNWDPKFLMTTRTLCKFQKRHHCQQQATFIMSLSSFPPVERIIPSSNLSSTHNDRRKTCHMCQRVAAGKIVAWWLCGNVGCRRFVCHDCAINETWIAIPHKNKPWTCPYCLGNCRCIACMKNRAKKAEQVMHRQNQTVDDLLRLSLALPPLPTAPKAIPATPAPPAPKATPAPPEDITSDEAPTVPSSPERPSTNVEVPPAPKKPENSITRIDEANPSSLPPKQLFSSLSVPMKRTTQFQKRSITSYQNYISSMNAKSGHNLSFSGGKTGLAVNIPTPGDGTYNVYQISDPDKNPLCVVVIDQKDDITSIFKSGKATSTKLGEVGVDSGNLLLTDPCYILPDVPISENHTLLSNSLAQLKRLVQNQKTEIAANCFEILCQFNDCWSKCDISKLTDYEAFLLLYQSRRKSSASMVVSQIFREKAESSPSVTLKQQCLAIANIFEIVGTKYTDSVDVSTLISQ